MEEESKIEESGQEPRKYTHNEIAKICRNEAFKIYKLHHPIYRFSEDHFGIKTTEKELRAKFAAFLGKKK